MCFGGDRNTDKDAMNRNREIEKLIRQDEKKAAKEVKLLLLGAGESGKSTIIKQMRMIYAQGFSKHEREEWRGVVFSNMQDAFKITIDAMESMNIKFADPALSKHIPIIQQDCELSQHSPLPMEYLEPFKALWADEGVQAAISKGNEFALHDNLSYFLNDVERLFAKDYMPSDQDVLRSRLRTTGITETIFDLGNLTYRMFDVGGQRSERKKWIHCFENVNCLLFLVAISGYDQCLIEDTDGNQMQEALMLWESIANSQWFTKSALILFLNKMDLFRAKLATSPITEHGFRDYSGDETDWRQVSKYFMDKFKALNRTPSKEIYGHFTNATDTDLLKKTMTSVQDMIIQRNLNQLIL